MKKEIKMISRIKAISIAMIVIFGMNGMSFAMSCDMGGVDHSGQASSQDAEKGPNTVNVGNKVCPVSGDKVDGNTTYKYKGRVYNFCCSMCITEFKKNPEKYIAKVEQSANGEQSMPEGHQHEC